jgi:hypothetical protein
MLEYGEPMPEWSARRALVAHYEKRVKAMDGKAMIVCLMLDG